MSVYFFDFVITLRFGIGTLLVLGATYVYGVYGHSVKQVRQSWQGS